MTSKLIFSLIIFLTFSTTTQAQCWPEGFTHDTRPDQQWLSCTQSPSPNTSRGNSIWIMYDLGHEYGLGTSTIWNYNEPGFTQLGITEMGVDYSLDGENWQSADSFPLQLGTGKRDYEGQDGPDLSGISARYILLTALKTGEANTGCAGLAEVRFKVNNTVSNQPQIADNQFRVFPNPTEGVLSISLSGRKIHQIALYDVHGKELLSTYSRQSASTLDISGFPAGFYVLLVSDPLGQSYQQKIILR